MTSSRIFTSNDVNILVAGIKNSHFSLSNVHKPIMIYDFDLMAEPRSSQNSEFLNTYSETCSNSNIKYRAIPSPKYYSTPNNHSNGDGVKIG